MSQGSSLGRILLLVGVLGLAHAAFSVVQYREAVKAHGQVFEALPLDVVLQVIITLVMSLVGLIMTKGNFTPIMAAETAKSYEASSMHPSFITFQHRGRVIAGSS